LITSANEIPNEATLNAKVCVVGSGAAGICLALELAKQGIDVCLLEGGGMTAEDASQDLHGGVNVGLGQFEIRSTRLRQWGGTTNHWGGMSPRLSAIDFQERAYLPHSGWPITLADLEPFYQPAERYCDISPIWRSYESGTCPAQTAMGFGKGPLGVQLTPWSPPTRFGQKYKSDIDRLGNLRTLTHANVVEIITDEGATTVTRVRARTLGGKQFFVNARAVVLTTGGLEAPKLLLASHRQQPKGLGNQNDLVGRYYMDHIGFWSGAALFSRKYAGFNTLTDYVTQNDERAHFLLTPRSKTMLQEAMVNFRYLFYQTPVSYEGVRASVEFVNEISNLQLPGEIGARIGDILVDIDQLVGKTISSKLPGVDIARSDTKTLSGRALPQAIAHLSMEQIPNPQSRVTLSDKKDALGERILKLDWQITQQDRNNILTAANMLGQSLGSNGFGRSYIPKHLRALNVDQEIEIACHHMGTTRMSNDPKTGVVDSNLQVHGVKNLYIASCSVFPTSGWANPTLTIVALSVRLADHLKKMLR